MRWQRLTVDRNPSFYEGFDRVARSRPLILSAGVAIAAVALALVVLPGNADAESVELVEDGVASRISERPELGMPASNPRVRGFVQSHPQDFVTVCVAGCNGEPKIVQMLPKPYEARAGAMRTTAGGSGSGNWDGPDDVVACLAGCGSGRPGEIVQRLPDLPPEQRAPARRKKAGESWEQELMDMLPD